MKVKMLKTVRSWHEGEVYDIDPGCAASWIELGHAVAVKSIDAPNADKSMKGRTRARRKAVTNE